MLEVVLVAVAELVVAATGVGRLAHSGSRSCTGCKEIVLQDFADLLAPVTVQPSGRCTHKRSQFAVHHRRPATSIQQAQRKSCKHTELQQLSLC